MENLDQKLAALEALLFIHGEPMSHKKIETVLQINKEDCDVLVDEIKKKLTDQFRGLMIFSDGEKIQLVTKPEFNTILEGFVKEELTEDLTPASAETLAIISYLGPISRAKIEYLRGVNSSLILRNLTMRGLIEKFSDEKHFSSFSYRITFDLMKHLGIEKKEDLPNYEKFSELSKVFDSENDQNINKKNSDNDVENEQKADVENEKVTSEN